MYKVIVAHPHQQHSYQLACGLKQYGLLDKYITTVYNKPKSLTRKVIPFLNGEIKKRAILRRTNELDDEYVLQMCEFWGLLYLLIMRLTHNNKKVLDPYNRFVSRLFGKKVAKYAIKNGVNAVICFDTECKEMFEYLQKKSPQIVRIMDASAINRLYLKKIYESDMKAFPDFATRLRNERPELFSKSSKRVMNRLKSEIDVTDYFLSPSKIVNDSFVYSGVKPEQLLKCPYGIELNEFRFSKRSCEKKALEVIYVGGIKELKGIGCLLKAFSKIPSTIAHLTIVGMGNPNDEDIIPYSKNITFTGHIIHKRIPELLKKADVFVFPSLGDSFGLAVLEAMSCGVVPIVSVNAGISDYINEPNQGFIISVNDMNSIVDKINWLYDNPHERIKMSENASVLAKQFTWENYHRKVAELVESVLKG